MDLLFLEELERSSSGRAYAWLPGETDILGIRESRHPARLRSCAQLETPEAIALSLAVCAWEECGTAGHGLTTCENGERWFLATQTNDESRLISGSREIFPAAEEMKSATLDAGLQELWLGREACVGDGLPAAILSGSFSPLHAGHRRLRQAAEKYLGISVSYEMPITNADKPPLDALRLRRRTAQFDAGEIFLTRAATFVEKAAVFPNAVFVVGMDTAVRIPDVRFYGNDIRARDEALAQIRARGCRFLVAGRLGSEQFQTRADMEIPAGFGELFEELPGFREDFSSTELREAGQFRDDFAVL